MLLPSDGLHNLDRDSTTATNPRLTELPVRTVPSGSRLNPSVGFVLISGQSR